MKAHVLQHVPFEDIGSMAAWLTARQVEVSYTRLFENPELPDLTGLDLIIVMGGPMSVNDEPAFPWLRPEKQFIRAAVARGAAVLGICLGAQLIAAALGARVYPNPHKEIGWFPIEATPHAGETFQFPPICAVFHWHGETFDLPRRAVQLARSAACENQAFQLGRNVMGLQFHLETTPRSAQALIDNCSADLISGPYIQPAVHLRAVAPAVYAELNTHCDQVLAYLTADALTGCPKRL